MAEAPCGVVSLEPVGLPNVDPAKVLRRVSRDASEAVNDRL